ncbi:MAG: NTP transferase domain-containing protein [Acidimicrobiia bacterium]
MDAVLLTGGRATRLGGVDKPSLDVGGLPMVERALRAASGAGAARVVVVGPDPGLPGVAAVTREEPPGSGPVAALAAGLPFLNAPEVALLATDLPFVTAGAVARLAAALAAAPSTTAAAVAVDRHGRDQPLLAVWRTPALRAAVASLGPPANRPMKALTAAAGGPVLRVADLDGGSQAPPWFDCDTADDLARARAAVERKPPMTPLDEWMDAVMAELALTGAIDRDTTRTLVLDLARDVAHGVARPAAPVTAFLAGLAAGRAGDARTATPEVAGRISELLGRWPGSSDDRDAGG